jgi:hypothetical protein
MAQGLTSILTLRFASEIDAVGGARFDDGAGGDNEVQRTMLGELGGVGLDDRSSFTTRADIFRPISDAYRTDRSVGWFRLSRGYQGVDGNQQVRVDCNTLDERSERVTDRTFPSLSIGPIPSTLPCCVPVDLTERSSLVSLISREGSRS